MSKQIEALITEKVAAIISDEDELFIVEVRIKGDTRNQRVQIFLDGDHGVDIDKCASVSRQLAAQLEAEEVFDSKYILEVSSPGLDMPLKLIRQYVKNIGRDLKIKTLSGSKIKGKLTDVVSAEKLVLANDKDEMIEILIKEIEEAKVTVSFN